MATVLKQKIEGRTDYPLPAEPSLGPAVYFQCSHYPIEENPNNPDPEWVVVREIDMAPPGSLYPLVFNKPDGRHPYNQLATIIGSLREGTYKRNYPVNQYYRPLDVQLAARTCFVFYLSERWNWRFSSKAGAVSLKVDDANDRARYSKLLHYVDNDAGQAEHFPHEKFCRIISFNAIPADDPVVPTTTSFRDSFNLVIEFVYPDGDAPNHENVIPIFVDPDVRFPGGSGGGT